MSTEWVELNGIEDIARAKVEGWEIEYSTKDGWSKWNGTGWYAGWTFRGRPEQPKKVVVTSECWRNKQHGGLSWAANPITGTYSKDWQRFPAGDITGEVEA
jgi:hypothetical protein